MTSPAPRRQPGRAEFALLAFFTAAALGSVLVGIFGLIAWGFIGVGLEAVVLLIGAVLLLVLGVYGSVRALRGERAWNAVAWIALDLVVQVVVHQLRH